MALAIYIKTFPKSKTSWWNKPNKSRDRFFFMVITIFGLSSIIFAVWPILIWQFVTLPRLTGGVESLPIPQSQVLSVQSSLANSVQVAKDPDGFSYFLPINNPNQNDNNSIASNESGEVSKIPIPEEFYISIPKLKINEAKVKVNSLNFYNYLAHFPGSALPGEVGNSFITGHSVLPQFNDPDNYRTIFTKLSDLEVGDDIDVKIRNRRLRFVVQYAKIVNPHDLTVLSPISQNGRNLTLMTCVPPGTNTKRLVVITSLI
ncbi:hypothetical protein A3F02_00690 [Candidatus Curtissbacteria bacterium RIFCSPHIGHO2_12_FULL_38_9b]|uniref:Sortase n=2 Tax=Candidatus Curtissiibacteriota TaxID=1752717 RepID=A0A1F5GX79_9BACT|nr:MAG: hypothetical protein A3A48_02955 [Candidatus Curtissbacteria bacterium RIFCSPLOWO2_01_FULL_37_9]OGD96520.1 MAG: hypothetical protein A3F02_00690 [Candidatus Curtissbacteria bacterium RIFCSPHIGHO2_12_FULL_38_9b]